MRLPSTEGTLDDSSGGGSHAPLSHVPAPSAATCMSSLEAARCLLRADGKLSKPTNGSTRALLLHMLALPAAT